MKIFALVLVVLLPFTCVCQNTTFSEIIQFRDTIIGGSANGFQLLEDGSFLIAQKYQDFGPTKVTRYLQLSKFDESGNEILKTERKDFNCANFSNLHLFEDKIIVLGEPESMADNSVKFQILEYSNGLTLLNEKTFVLDEYKRMRTMGARVNNGELYIYGFARNSITSQVEAYILQINLLDYSISNLHAFKQGIYENITQSIEFRPNDNLVTFISHRDGFGTSWDGSSIYEITPEGEHIDSFQYSDGSTFLPYSVAVSPENKVVFQEEYDFTGKYRPSDSHAFIMFFENQQLDSIGNIALFPNDSYHSRNVQVFAISFAENGDLLVAGSSRDRRATLLNCHAVCAFVARFTSDGRSLWVRSFMVPHTPFEGEPDICIGSRIETIIEAENGDIITEGSWYPSERPRDEFGQGWIMRLNEHGCLDDRPCEEFIILSEGIDTTPHSLFSPGYEWSEFSGASWELDEDGVYPGKSTRYRFKQGSDHFSGEFYLELMKSEEPSGDTNFVDTGIFMKRRGGKIYIFNPNNDGGPFTDDNNLLLYDFKAEMGDTIPINVTPIAEQVYFGTAEPYRMIVGGIDSVEMLNGEVRKRWSLYCEGTTFQPNSPDYTYIDGIGEPRGLFYPYFAGCGATDTPNTRLICYNSFGEKLFPTQEFELINPQGNCFVENSVSTSNPKAFVTDFSIFPNPTSGTISITDINVSSATLYTLSGQQITTYLQGNTLHIENVIAGMYLLRVENELNQIGIKKIVVR